MTLKSSWTMMILAQYDEVVDLMNLHLMNYRLHYQLLMLMVEVLVVVELNGLVDDVLVYLDLLVVGLVQRLM